MHADSSTVPFAAGTGMPSPPASPYSSHSGSGTAAPSFHPLLRVPTSANEHPALYYNVLTTPDNAQLTHSALYAPSELNAPATNPPAASLRVRVLSYPGGLSAHSVHAPPHEFPWPIALAPRHRTSAPPAPNQPSAPLTMKDVLRSVYMAMMAPVEEHELAWFSPQQVQCARASANVRRARGRLVRADFLYGCTQFAGFMRNSDNSFALVMIAPPQL